MSAYAGADWIKDSLGVEKMSAIGEATANLLGDVFLGIYHLPRRALARVDWADPQCVEFVIGQDLATYDFDELTRLVVLAHDRMIRVEMCGCGPSYIRMRFHQRHQRQGGEVWDRMPTLEDHAAFIRRHYEGRGRPTYNQSQVADEPTEVGAA